MSSCCDACLWLLSWLSSLRALTGRPPWLQDQDGPTSRGEGQPVGSALQRLLAQAVRVPHQRGGVHVRAGRQVRVQVHLQGVRPGARGHPGGVRGRDQAVPGLPVRVDVRGSLEALCVLGVPPVACGRVARRAPAPATDGALPREPAAVARGGDRQSPTHPAAGVVRVQQEAAGPVRGRPAPGSQDAGAASVGDLLQRHSYRGSMGRWQQGVEAA